MHKGQQVLLEGSIATFASPGVAADVAADRWPLGIGIGVHVKVGVSVISKQGKVKSDCRSLAPKTKPLP
jgi:hypothetical protein